MKAIIKQLVREAIIDGDMQELLERSRQGEIFNLYDELEKLGFSQNEIVAAAIREMERQARGLRRIGSILTIQAIAEGLLLPEDFS